MGLIHIYCGAGKGKTTAALGLALRAAGSGMNAHIVQLLKGGETAELESLKFISNISVSRSGKNFGFTFNMGAAEKRELTEIHNAILLDAEKRMKNGIDMLVIDEFFAACEYNLADRNILERIVFQKPEKTELVLTGRNPEQKFISAADYVSEIKAVKHPYEKGISARKGIEY